MRKGSKQTADARRKMSETRKRLYSEGRIVHPMKGRSFIPNKNQLRALEEGRKLSHTKESYLKKVETRRMKGNYKFSEETKKKMSEARKGIHFSPKTEFKKGIIPWMKGRHPSKETIEKQRTALLKTYSTNPLVKKRISETIKKVMTNPERKKKMSEVLKKNWTNPEIRKKMIQSGEKAPNWKGGISFEPYSPEWTKVLKNMIRERDKYICQMCGKTQEEQKRKDGRSLTIHHIDYNKMNCNSENLITLCRSCHSRTSSGKREKWKKFFEEKRYPT